MLNFAYLVVWQVQHLQINRRGDLKWDYANLIMTEIELAYFLRWHEVWNLSYFEAFTLICSVLPIEIVHSLLLFGYLKINASIIANIITLNNS